MDRSKKIKLLEIFLFQKNKNFFFKIFTFLLRADCAARLRANFFPK